MIWLFIGILIIVIAPILRFFYQAFRDHAEMVAYHNSEEHRREMKAIEDELASEDAQEHHNEDLARKSGTQI
ncbi:MAG: hypothetical protein EXQ47_04410 [Bryobacterales bacterium]|nr:hypothetical protein [Bryobacterales bacterium]